MSNKENLSQSPLFNSEGGQPKELALERVIVETLPTHMKHKGSSEWHCQAYAGADIFNQDRDEHYQLHARTYSRQARKQRLRPGDMINLRGIPSTQEVETASGEKRVIHHLNVTHIDVLSRAERISLTVYEKQRGR